MQTARDQAQALLEQNLAGINAGFAGAGMGNSSRRALERGAAIGTAATGLGDVLAQRGLATRQQDLDRLLAASGQQGAFNQQDVGRGLQAMLGAGQLEQGQQGLNLQGQGLAMQGLQQLGQLGTGLAGIGAQEQTLPSLAQVIALLGQFGKTSGGTQTSGRTLAGLGI